VSTFQRTDVSHVPVDPSTIDVLRRQSLIVLEANHDLFEDLLDYGPEAQHALSLIYRDAFAVLDAIGWATDAPAEPVDVPLTARHVEQLHRRRHDLGRANLDRLDVRDELTDPDELAEIDAEITADRLAAQALDRLFSAWARARGW
jgi:hypothetical protein